MSTLLQYQKFFINGVGLATLGWALQLLCFHVLGGKESHTYAIASVVAYVPLIIVNFLIQRSWIFKTNGSIWRFVTVHLLVMVLVAGLSVVFRAVISIWFNFQIADVFGYLAATLIGSIPSFMMQKWWVFNHD